MSVSGSAWSPRTSTSHTLYQPQIPAYHKAHRFLGPTKTHRHRRSRTPPVVFPHPAQVKKTNEKLNDRRKIRLHQRPRKMSEKVLLCQNHRPRVTSEHQPLRQNFNPVRMHHPQHHMFDFTNVTINCINLKF